MKKTFLMLPVCLLSLASCGGGYETADSPKETVQLTAQNFSTYVAVNTTCTMFEGQNYALYYSYFIGADECKFIDCTVTYKYTGANGSDAITVPLSLSGDGQAKPFSGKIVVGGSYYSLAITAAAGTVEVYR